MAQIRPSKAKGLEYSAKSIGKGEKGNDEITTCPYNCSVIVNKPNIITSYL